MARPLVDRRRDPRIGHPALAGTEVILRPGYAVSLVDLSAGGALIQGPRPLRPGARVHLQLVTGTRRLVLSGHILRCSVSALDSPQGVQYRGAVQFDDRCESLWENVALDGYLVPGEDRATTQPGGHGIPAVRPVADDGIDREQQ